MRTATCPAAAQPTLSCVNTDRLPGACANKLQLIPEAMHALKATLGHAEYTKYRFIIEAGRRARAVDAEGGGGRAAVDGIDESGV